MTAGGVGLRRKASRLGALRLPSRRRLLFLAAVLGFVALAVWYWTRALQVHSFQLDEEAYMQWARITGRGDASLIAVDPYGKGLQRLTVWLLALPTQLRNPLGFQIAHLLQVAAFSLAAVPVYLLARGLGLQRAIALIPAALALLIPWAVLSTSFLTEPVTYPSFTLCIYAIWWALAHPGWRGDLLALASICLLALARTNFIVMPLALWIGIVAQTARYPGEPGLRGRLRSLLKGHPIALGALAVAVLAVATGQADSLAGKYGTGHTTNLGVLLPNFEQRFSRVITGTSFVPACLAGAWSIQQLIRPRDPRSHALAIIVPLACLLVLWSTWGGGPDERYYFYLAPVLFVAATAALVQRSVHPVAVVAAGIAALLIVRHASWQLDQGPYQFFAFPAEAFWARAVLANISRHIASVWSPLSQQIVANALMAAAVAVAALALVRWRRRSLAVGAVLAAILVVQAIQMQYSLGKYLAGAGLKTAQTLSQRAWIDRSVPDAKESAFFAVSNGATGEWNPIWQELGFWNNSPHIMAARDYRPNLMIPLGYTLLIFHMDDDSGAVATTEFGSNRKTELPPYLVVPRQFQEVSLRGRLVKASDYLPADIYAIEQPAWARWSIAGPDLDSWLRRGQQAVVRFYSHGLNPAVAWCANLGLQPAPAQVGAHRWTVRIGSRVKTGTIKTGQLVNVHVRLPPIASGWRHVDVTASGRGDTRYVDGRHLTFGLAGESVQRCGT